jgi:hypothetical protein
MYDTIQTFTHAFTPGTTVTLIAKACNQEWDTLQYQHIYTNMSLLHYNETGMIGNIYPNPTNNNTTITYFLGVNHQAQLQIFNTSGELMQFQTITGMSGKANVNTSELSNGVYIIKLNRDDGNTCYKKLLVQH